MQIEQSFLQQAISGFEVCDDYALAAVSPALSVLSQNALGKSTVVPWALDLVAHADDQQLFAQNQYAQSSVSEYWLLDTTNVELRVYRNLTSAGYQQRLLFHEGETVSPLAFPQLVLKVQEPLPLFFLTRTTTGQKVHPTTLLPLHVSSLLER